MTAPSGDGARVLVAIDDERALGVLCWLLRDRGYQVAGVGDRRVIVETLAAMQPDLLLLDAGALDGGGEALLERIKGDARWHDLPVIVAVPAPRPAPRGADDVVAKPWVVPELLARIQTQLRARAELRAARAALHEVQAALERARENVSRDRLVVEILHEVSSELSATEIFRVLARRVARALVVSHCSVIVVAEGEGVGVVAASYEAPTVEALEIRLDRYPELMAALETQRPVLVEDAQSDPLFARVRGVWRAEAMDVPVRSVVTIPFAVDRWHSGILFLRTDRMERTLTSEDVAFAELVVHAAVAAIKRAHTLETTRADNRRLEALATTDPLTRLLNRRALLERLSSEVDRARRFGSVLTLLLLDIDHFKMVNDTAGHLAGDGVLRQVGDLLAAAVRIVDVAGRYGGEEFVVMLPETSLEGAVIFAERLRERIERHRFHVGGREPLHLTASIGVATFPSPRVESTEDLFARADEALYRAKSGGRNQVRT